MTDILIDQTEDGADITVDNGFINITDSLETSVFISLLGGSSDYWGNTVAIDEDEKLQSQFQDLLQKTTATTRDLLKLQTAGLNDLDWLKNKGFVTTIDIGLTMIDAKRLKIFVNLDLSRFELATQIGS